MSAGVRGTHTTLTVRPERHGFGAEVSGVDLRQPPAEETQPPVASNRTGVALRTHKIVRNDNYGTLAQHYLGSARYDKEIEKANPGIDPRKLQIGMEIKNITIPTEREIERFWY